MMPSPAKRAVPLALDICQTVFLIPVKHTQFALRSAFLLMRFAVGRQVGGSRCRGG
jgi:hypothetical protein